MRDLTDHHPHRVRTHRKRADVLRRRGAVDDLRIARGDDRTGLQRLRRINVDVVVDVKRLDVTDGGGLQVQRRCDRRYHCRRCRTGRRGDADLQIRRARRERLCRGRRGVCAAAERDRREQSEEYGRTEAAHDRL